MASNFYKTDLEKHFIAVLKIAISASKCFAICTATAVEIARKLSNPTHGSGWMVQIQPTYVQARSEMNPTNGSWWIVQIRPAKQSGRAHSNSESQLHGSSV
jgi:hypothetical protein